MKNEIHWGGAGVDSKVTGFILVERRWSSQREGGPKRGIPENGYYLVVYVDLHELFELAPTQS